MIPLILPATAWFRGVHSLIQPIKRGGFHCNRRLANLNYVKQNCFMRKSEL
jgi:hypothetical protein